MCGQLLTPSKAIIVLRVHAVSGMNWNITSVFLVLLGFVIAFDIVRVYSIASLRENDRRINTLQYRAVTDHLIISANEPGGCLVVDGSNPIITNQYDSPLMHSLGRTEPPQAVGPLYKS